jgi:hypothetical protein
MEPVRKMPASSADIRFAPSRALETASMVE